MTKKLRHLGLVAVVLIVGCGKAPQANTVPAKTGFKPAWDIKAVWEVTSRSCGTQTLALKLGETYRLDEWHVVHVVEQLERTRICKNALVFEKTLSGFNANDTSLTEQGILKTIGIKNVCWKRSATGEAIEPPITDAALKAVEKRYTFLMDLTQNEAKIQISGTADCPSDVENLTLKKL